jgi:methionyl aminopeptidase
MIVDELGRQVNNVISEEDVDKLVRAGKIAAEALHYGKSLIKKDNTMLDMLDKVEDKIKQLGAEPAFPAQASCNDIAAHYCPEEDDTIVFSDQLVSLDVGVHVDGFIGDNAVTVDLSGEHSELVKASREALNNAIKAVSVGAYNSEIGQVIDETITSFGFKPVRNLSGHGLGRYNIHTKPSMPNFNTAEKFKLEENMVIAIEPFASSGAGLIYEINEASVFMQIAKKNVRGAFGRALLKEISKYNGMAFAARWLTRKLGKAKVNFGMRELMLAEIVRAHPPLVDKEHGMVSQAEHTVLVKDKPVVLTRWDE